jgi:hypothetical protein
VYASQPSGERNEIDRERKHDDPNYEHQQNIRRPPFYRHVSTPGSAAALARQISQFTSERFTVNALRGCHWPHKLRARWSGTEMMPTYTAVASGVGVSHEMMKSRKRRL